MITAFPGRLRAVSINSQTISAHLYTPSGKTLTRRLLDQHPESDVLPFDPRPPCAYNCDLGATTGYASGTTLVPHTAKKGVDALPEAAHPTLAREYQAQRASRLAPDTSTNRATLVTHPTIKQPEPHSADVFACKNPSLPSGSQGTPQHMQEPRKSRAREHA